MSQEIKSAQVLQYEALEWVWNLAKKFDDDEEGIQKFRDYIAKYLAIITETGAIDFSITLKELNEGLW